MKNKSMPRPSSPFDYDFIKGGPGSGNFGHAGRPGEVGGSGGGGGAGAGKLKVGDKLPARVSQADLKPGDIFEDRNGIVFTPADRGGERLLAGERGANDELKAIPSDRFSGGESVYQSTDNDENGISGGLQRLRQLQQKGIKSKLVLQHRAAGTSAFAIHLRVPAGSVSVAQNLINEGIEPKI